MARDGQRVLSGFGGSGPAVAGAVKVGLVHRQEAVMDRKMEAAPLVRTNIQEKQEKKIGEEAGKEAWFLSKWEVMVDRLAGRPKITQPNFKIILIF